MMEKIRLICLGAGGHAGMILEVLEEDPRYEMVGLLDNNPALHGKYIQGVRVLGDDSELKKLKDNNINHFIVGIGATRSCALRKAIFDKAIQLNMVPVTLVHQSVRMMRTAVICEGAVVMPGAVINRNVFIGRNVIVNSAVVVEHDTRVGDHSHIASSACIAGGVKIGEEVLVGANATIKENIILENRSVVGAGSVVVKPVLSGQMVVGIPAREMTFQ